MAIAWYVLHTYSGHENRVQSNLEQRIRAMGMEEKVFQILVPTQEVANQKWEEEGIFKNILSGICPGENGPGQ